MSVYSLNIWFLYVYIDFYDVFCILKWYVLHSLNTQDEVCKGHYSRVKITPKDKSSFTGEISIAYRIAYGDLIFYLFVKSDHFSTLVLKGCCTLYQN